MFAKLDAKFAGLIYKVKDGSIVPDDEYMVFLAQDKAFLPTLVFYRAECVRQGADKEHIDAVDRTIAAEPRARIEYAELRDPVTLEEVEEVGSATLLALAVWVGNVRLIDNRVLHPGRPVR